MFKRWPKALNEFRSEERGSVAILFGLMATALIFLAGMAVDYGRILDMRERVASAVDSASLAAGRALLEGKLSDGEIVDMAKAYFEKNVESARAMGIVNDPNISVDRDTSAVNIDVDAKVKMTLTRIGGFKEIDVPVTSAAVFQQRDIEVGMALDITGSMDGYVGGQRKIDALKWAFEKFAETLYPTQANSTQRVRVGVAPYSASVNLGSYAGYVSGGKSKDGCVIERKSGTFDDSTSVFAVKADATKSQSSYSCPNQAIIPLSEDKDDLVKKVQKFTTGGNTAGHLGAQWAWNLVSDKWAGTWGGNSAPDPYQRVLDDKLIKAVVLMTDGEFNTAYRGSTSAAQALELCNAMKTSGILVFTVGFGLGGNAAAVATLEQCATPGVGYHANANNANELDAALQKFAGTLTALRLAK